MNPPKINTVGICPLCSNYVCIVKDRKNGKLYARCLECLAKFSTIDEAKKFVRNELSASESGNETDDLAPAEEIRSSEWNVPRHKVCFCHECVLRRSKWIGWVTVKKIQKTNALVCVCEHCGSFWSSPEEAAHLNSPDTAPKLEDRFIRAQGILTEETCEADKRDLFKSGWI